MARRRTKFSRGKWSVQRDRLAIDAGAPPAGARDATPLGAILSAVMKKMGLDSQLWVNTLESEWSAIVGAAVARHTRPGRLDGNRLVVYVDSPAWLNELSRYGKRQIQDNLTARFGAERVRGVVLALDPDKAGA